MLMSLGLIFGILIGVGGAIGAQNTKQFSGKNRGMRLIKFSVFSQIADSSSESLHYVATRDKQKKEPKSLKAKKVLAIEPAPKAVIKIEDIISYLNTLTLPNKLKTHSFLVLEGALKVQNDETLEIEVRHDMELVSEQIMNTFRLYDSLPKDKQASPEVIAEITSQLQVLLDAVKEHTDQHINSIVNQIKVNTAFLKARFAKEKEGLLS